MKTCANTRSVIFTFLVSAFGGDCDFNGAEIYAKILSANNPLIPPTGGNISIGIELALSEIQEINMKRQEMTSRLTLNLYWKDYALGWNHRQYPKLDKVVLPASKIWTPNIILYNMADKYRRSFVDDGEVSVSSTGQIQWTIFDTFKSSCTIDVTYYPFDQQTCVLKFGPYMDNNILLGIHENKNWGSLDAFYPSVEWTIVELPAYSNVYRMKGSASSTEQVVETDVTFYVTIRRKGYWFSQVYPFLAIAFITILPCFLANFHTKLAFQFVCLAGLLKLSKDAADILPTTSFVTCHLIKYIYALVIFNLIHMTFTVALSHFRPHQLDWVIQYVPKEMVEKICTFLCLNNEKPKNKAEIENEQEAGIPNVEESDQEDKIYAIILRLIGIFIILGVLIATICFLFIHPHSNMTWEEQQEVQKSYSYRSTPQIS